MDSGIDQKHPGVTEMALDISRRWALEDRKIETWEMAGVGACSYATQGPGNLAWPLK
jgi:hypothetical protein